MNNLRTLTVLSWLLAGAGFSFGQGLLSIGNTSEDYETDIPVTWTGTFVVGYDDNVSSAPRDEQDSFFVQAGVGARYAGGSRVTRYNFGASFSILWYDEKVRQVGSSDTEDVFYNARVSLGINHRISRRLGITNNSYISYEIEPDNDIGASRIRRTDQYVYGYNRFSVRYAWTRRFQTVTSYAISWIGYEDADLDDRVRHVLTLQGRYLYTRNTTLTAEYRYGYTDYDERGSIKDHFFLVGADHNFSRLTRGSIRVGAQVRDYSGGSRTRPYVEGSIIHRPSEDLSLRAVVRYGFEDGELGLYGRRQSLRFGVSGSYSFTPRLTGTAGVTYMHNSFEDSEFVGISDGDEDFFAFNLGLSYLLYSNVRLNAGYSYVTLDSDRDDIARDYDRNRFRLGVSATF